MQIDVDDIFKFYELRIKCHVAAVNYFAALLGHSFPDHDGDKVNEPVRTGYAYIFYNNYHPKLHLMNEYFELCDIAKETHHKHATHHIPHYANVCEIPDLRIYEMVSDWASANFEQMNILHDADAIPLEQWFENNMAQLPWTKHQIDLIKKSFEIIKTKTDENAVKNIWSDLIESL